MGSVIRNEMSCRGFLRLHKITFQELKSPGTNHTVAPSTSFTMLSTTSVPMLPTSSFTMLSTTIFTTSATVFHPHLPSCSKIQRPTFPSPPFPSPPLNCPLLDLFILHLVDCQKGSTVFVFIPSCVLVLFVFIFCCAL